MFRIHIIIVFISLKSACAHWSIHIFVPLYVISRRVALRRFVRPERILSDPRLSNESISAIRANFSYFALTKRSVFSVENGSLDYVSFAVSKEPNATKMDFYGLVLAVYNMNAPAKTMYF